MKKLPILCVLFFVLLSFSAAAQNSAFNYQGALAQNGTPANGQFDLVFRLFADSKGGNQLAPEITLENVQVTNGKFSVELSFDFQPFTTVAAQYLEIAVRPGSSTGEFTTLTPRHHLTSSPYAMKSAFSTFSTFADSATNADNALNAANADAVGGTPAAQIIKEGDIRLADMRLPAPGSSSYVQINPTGPQSGGFDILGNAKIRSTLDVQGQTTLRSNTFVLGTLSGNGSGLTNLNASNVNGLGSLATVSPTGTADGATFLRGDGQWAKPPIYFMSSVARGDSPNAEDYFFEPIGRVTTFNSSSTGAFIRVPRPCVLRSFEVLSSTPFHDPRTFTIVKRSGPTFEFTTISIALDNGQIFGSSPNSVSMAAGDAFAIRESKPAGGSLSSTYYFYFTSVCE